MHDTSSAAQSRRNNFDFLRFAAAFCVLVSHQFALNRMPEPKVFSMSLGTFGVLIFFSISGFLVSRSWRTDPSSWRFLAKRFLRIWPGLAVVTLVAAFALGPLVTTLDTAAYFSHPLLPDFLRNLKVVTVRYFLPGVFESNPYPKAVNGSLWTIPIEVRCYLVLLVIGVVGLMRRKWLVVSGTVAFAIYYFAVVRDPENHQFHFALYFFVGACLDLFREHWERRPLRLLAAAAALAIVFFLADAGRVAMLALLPALVVFAGTRSWFVLKNFGRYGDLSYGIYIYAFPVQQTVLWMGGKSLGFLPGLAIASVATVACAFLSWHLVEAPALRLKPGVTLRLSFRMWRSRAGG